MKLNVCKPKIYSELLHNHMNMFLYNDCRVISNVDVHATSKKQNIKKFYNEHMLSHLVGCFMSPELKTIQKITMNVSYCSR